MPLFVVVEADIAYGGVTEVVWPHKTYESEKRRELFNNSNSFTIHSGANASETISVVASNTTVDSADALSIDAADIVLTTQSGANTAIGALDTALGHIASHRAVLGATQAQLESTVRNLSNVAENTAAAAGRIMDTDYAAETANLTKAQILQQAATSMVAGWQ